MEKEPNLLKSAAKTALFVFAAVSGISGEIRLNVPNPVEDAQSIVRSLKNSNDTSETSIDQETPLISEVR